MTNTIKITSSTSTNTANKAVIYTEGITDKVVIATANLVANEILDLDRESERILSEDK